MTNKRKFGVKGPQDEKGGGEGGNARMDTRYRERETVAHRSSMELTETGTDHSTIREKEEALEQIMCAEAETAFHQMNRYQMEPRNLSRCCINPETLADYDEDNVWSILDGSDLQEVLSDSDDEFEKEHGLTVHELEAGYAPTSVPANDVDPDFRCGYHFPASKVESSQDRMFVAHCGPYTLYGLVNGHGQAQITHQLCKFIAEEMPRAIFRSAHFVKGDVPGALNKAFHRVHHKGIESVDCRFSGAACTVLLLSPDTVWVAHVGDCKVVLGVPDSLPNAEEYHFCPVALTKEHRLALQGEFDRIVKSGGEVRRLANDHSHRTFMKNEDWPGLTMTRAIGDRVGHHIGVIHQPTIGVLRKSDLPPGAFFAVASGGLWATMSERTVVNWVGRYFQDANEAAKCLTEEATKRWEDPPGQHFHHGPEPDCFSAMVLFPGISAADASGTSKHRPFAVGPHQRQAR
jgi:serine/threonine protein phosphatase PrpC